MPAVYSLTPYPLDSDAQDPLAPSYGSLLALPTRDFTATTFVVDAGKTLLILHRKIGKWFPPGGHIHPDELPCDAAVREVNEETGLAVELVSPRSTLGDVRLLSRPEHILLEPIEPGHEHIDLIYFARVVGGSVDVSRNEADDWRWCSHDELNDPVIPEDIRLLGRQAIQTVAGICDPDRERNVFRAD